MLFGWAGVGAMSFGRAPVCKDGLAAQVVDIYQWSGVLFASLCGGAVAIGAASAIVHAYEGGRLDDDEDYADSGGIPSRWVRVASLVVNVLFVGTAAFAGSGQYWVTTRVVPGASEVDDIRHGPVGTVFCIGTAGICVLWGVVDIIADGIGCAAHLYGRDTDEYTEVQTREPEERVDLQPPNTVMYMMDDRLYATMKKGDDMPQAGGGHTHPRSGAAGSHHGNRGDSMFVNEDVRKFLRQRA